MPVKASISLQFLRCPRCGAKTRVCVRDGTVLRNLPLHCPKCGYDCVIAYENGKLNIAPEPDAQVR